MYVPAAPRSALSPPPHLQPTSLTFLVALYGMQVNTLMKYLLDDLQNSESSHQDALCPIQTEADQTFMGEHKALELLTKRDLQVFGSSLVTTVQAALMTTGHRFLPGESSRPMLQPLPQPPVGPVPLFCHLAEPLLRAPT